MYAIEDILRWDSRDWSKTLCFIKQFENITWIMGSISESSTSKCEK